MPELWTPQLRVASITSSSAKLAYELRAPYQPPLYLSTIIVSRVSASGVSGAINPVGKDETTGGGIARVYVDKATFADLRASAYLPMSVSLCYDPVSLRVCDIEQRHGEADLAAFFGAAQAPELSESTENRGSSNGGGYPTGAAE